MKCLYLCINTCRSQPDTNIKDKHPENCQSALSAAQILQFNSSTKRQNSATGMYHSRDKETPLPVYVGLLIHGRTRKRDTFFQLGLSIFLWPGTQHINGHGDCGSCTVWEGWSCSSIHPEEGLVHNRCHRQYRPQSHIKYCRAIISRHRHFHVPEQDKSIRWHQARAATRGNFSHLESTAYLTTTQM